MINSYIFIISTIIKWFALGQFWTTPARTKANQSSIFYLSLISNHQTPRYWGFSKWVNQILLFINFLKLDDTLIHELPDKVVAMQNVFGKLMGLRIHYLSYGSNAVQYSRIGPLTGGATLCSSMNFHNHIAFLVASDAMIQFMMQIKLAIVFCSKLFQ